MCKAPTQHGSLWFPTSLRDEWWCRDEQGNGEEGEEETLSISLFSQCSSQWSWAGMREKQDVLATGLPYPTPSNSATCGEQGRDDTWFSQFLGGGEGVITLKALSQSSISPCGCVICSKWDWPLSLPVWVSWAVARPEQDLTGLVFRSAQMGHCARVAGCGF